jgi:hypothetical protein
MAQPALRPHKQRTFVFFNGGELVALVRGDCSAGSLPDAQA